MKVSLVIILSLIATVGAVGCVQTDTSVVNDFHRLGKLVFVDPDSAAVVLDGIRRDDLRDVASRSKYDLLRTIIDDRLGIKHRSPDAILSARDYLIKADTSDSMLTIAHLYTGRVYEDLGEYENALDSYFTARSHSKKTDGNNHLKGRIAYNIGNLYHNDKDYAYASTFLEQAIDHFNAEGDILNAAHTYNLLGANHIVSKKIKEGFEAMNKAGIIYDSLRDTDGVMSNALTTAGLCLHHLNDVSKADSVMRRVHGEYNDGIIPRTHLPVMSQIEAGKGNYGKAEEFLQNYLALTPDLPLKKRGAFYSLMSYYDSQEGEYTSAYNHLSEYVNIMDSLYDDKIVKVLQEVEKKYEKQTLENEYEAYRKVVFYRIFVGVICFLAVISVMVVKIKRRKRKYLDLEADLDRLKSQIKAFDDLKNTLSNVLDKKVERETRLYEVLTNKILHIQKIANYLILYDETRSEKFREKVLSEIIKAEKDNYFGELHEVVNAKYAGIVDYLKREYPILTVDELNLCCLVCFGFDNNLISFLFGLTNPNSIFIKRHRLRKKLGGSLNYDSLGAYLSKLISDLQSGSSDCVPMDVDRTGDS